MSDALKQISDELAGMVETAGRGVVRVEARRRLPATGVIWSPDLIITAHHVVERDEDLRIGLADGNTVSAALVGRDPSTDVAVLRVKDAALNAATWADGDDLKVGHLVLALGRPGAQIQATLGVVSALGGELEPENEGEGRRGRRGHGRRWAERAGRLDKFIQTDVVMYPGFSGGALVDAAGAVRGINSSGFMRGISLTIPTGVIRRTADQLMKHGRVQQAYLGVSLQTAKLPGTLVKQLEQETALMVMSVEPDAPADKAGITMGDVLVTFDGVPLENVEDLLSTLSMTPVGADVPLTLVRGGQVHEFRVTVTEKK